MTCKPLLAACAALVLVGGCSSRPREFVATLSAPPVDQTAFERDLATCRALVASGVRSEFAAVAASGGAGMVAGVGAVGAAGAAGVAGPFMGAAAGTTVAAAVPLVGVLAAWGVARGIRSGRERRQNAAMTDCLAEHGHDVAAWTPARRSRPAGDAEDDFAAEAPAAAAPADADSTL